MLIDPASCRVHFATVEARDKCIEKLNGLEWKGLKLEAAVNVDRTTRIDSTKVFPLLPPGLRSEEVKNILEEILGKNSVADVSVSNHSGMRQFINFNFKVLILVCHLDTNTLAFVNFVSPEVANKAVRMIDGKEIRGVRQRVKKFILKPQNVTNVPLNKS